MATFGKGLSEAAIGVCALFFVVGWLRSELLLNLRVVSVLLAVAAIPEALPALVTVALVLGAKRLVKSQALIRKLAAVETLGSVTYICTDKIGTLTLNQMTVQQTYEIPPPAFAGLDRPSALLAAMALNNDATQDPQQAWLGDSTEVALVRHAAGHDYDRAALEAQFPRLAELPFDSQRKCMTTLHQTPQGVLSLTKGAVDVLLSQLSPGQQGAVADLEQRVNVIAEQGYRVLGYAGKLLLVLPARPDAAALETDLTFIGFAGLLDPPRDEARLAVAECRAGGIIPVMITGDHRLTARAVAVSLGNIASGQDLVLTGPELTRLDEAAFDAVVEKVRVYARVDPAQKLRIIQALQARHQFVAMTGDGVNDAPALKNADIGIAMGINGTEVSKAAAHMILLDDNFATIVTAVKHGRRIFDNIIKFIRYIMSGNVSELLAIFLALLFGLPIPLLVIQILWLNLISDGLPGLALAYDPAEANAMRRPPLDPRQTIFAGGTGWFILGVGVLIGIFVYFGAYSENVAVQHLDLLRDYTVRQAMMTNFVTLVPADTVQVAADKLLSGSDQDLIVVEHDRAVGVMTRLLIIESLRADRGTVAVAVTAVMNREFETVDIGAGLGDVYDRARCKLNAFYPVLENERFRGVIDQNNIDEFLKIRAALSH